jgi:hypothetical protein
MWRPCGGLECDCASNGESGTGLHGAAPFFDQREKENSRLAAVRLLRPSAIFNAGAGEERARAKTKQQPERLCSRCSLLNTSKAGRGSCTAPHPAPFCHASLLRPPAVFNLGGRRYVQPWPLFLRAHQQQHAMRNLDDAQPYSVRTRAVKRLWKGSATDFDSHGDGLTAKIWTLRNRARRKSKVCRDIGRLWTMLVRTLNQRARSSSVPRHQ